jgi:pimeloyl-ACP methyl ester carboxylesterase
MPLVPALRRASVVAILFLGASAAQASVAFHVTVTTERVNQPGVRTSLPARDTQESDVVLGPHYLSVRDGNRLSVLDFAARRRHVIDMAASTYDTYSLFDVAGFRAAELHHRQGLAGMLKADGLEPLRRAPRVPDAPTGRCAERCAGPGRGPARIALHGKSWFHPGRPADPQHGRIAHLPAVIVQSRYDAICPPLSAYRLQQAWPGAQLEMIPDAGHGALEHSIASALVRATELFVPGRGFA